MQGMGTATLEAKLEQQLVGISHDPLFQVFLDVQKSYISLDRGAVFGNIEGVRDGS